MKTNNEANSHDQKNMIRNWLKYYQKLLRQTLTIEYDQKFDNDKPYRKYIIINKVYIVLKSVMFTKIWSYSFSHIFLVM